MEPSAPASKTSPSPMSPPIRPSRDPVPPIQLLSSISPEMTAQTLKSPEHGQLSILPIMRPLGPRPIFTTILPKTDSLSALSLTEQPPKQKKPSSRRLSAIGLTRPKYLTATTSGDTPSASLASMLLLPKIEMSQNLEVPKETPLAPLDVIDTNRGDIVCVCGDATDSHGMTLQCEKCFSWQHVKCLGFSKNSMPKESYYCLSWRSKFPELHPEELDIITVSDQPQEKKKKERKPRKAPKEDAPVAEKDVEITSLPVQTPPITLVQCVDPHFYFAYVPYDSYCTKVSPSAKPLIMKNWYEYMRLKKRREQYCAPTLVTSFIDYPRETPPIFVGQASNHRQAGTETLFEEAFLDCVYRNEAKLFAYLKDSKRPRMVHQSFKIRLDTEFLILTSLRNSSKESTETPDLVLSLVDELSHKRYEAFKKSGVVLDLSEAPPELVGYVSSSGSGFSSLSSSLSSANSLNSSCFYYCEAGSLLGLVAGKLCSKDEFALKKDPREFILQSYVFFHPGLDFAVDSRQSGNVTRFMRRSCRPNVAIRGIFTSPDNAQPSPLNPPGFHLGIFATRSIFHGEELVLPLDFSHGNQSCVYDCGCDRPEFCLIPRLSADIKPNAELETPVELEDEDRRRSYKDRLHAEENRLLSTRRNKPTSRIVGHLSLPNLSALVKKRKKRILKTKMASSSLAGSPVGTADAVEASFGFSEEELAESAVLDASSPVSSPRKRKRSSPPKLSPEQKQPQLSREERKLQMVIESIKRAEEREEKKKKHQRKSEDLESPSRRLQADETLE